MDNNTITLGQLLMKYSGGLITSEQSANIIIKITAALTVAVIAWKIFSVEPDPTYTPKKNRSFESHNKIIQQHEQARP